MRERRFIIDRGPSIMQIFVPDGSFQYQARVLDGELVIDDNGSIIPVTAGTSADQTRGVARLVPWLERNGRRGAVLLARSGQLALIDLAYHQVSDQGPFQQLDQEGRLSHLLVPVQDKSTTVLDVAGRLTTRAAPRAELIAALSGRPGVVCNWAGLEGKALLDRIDLSNPLRTETPRWQNKGERVPSPGVNRDDTASPRRLRAQASSR